MSVRVALVIVSHSDLLARGVVELAQQMAPHVWCEPAGGMEEARLGTSLARIERAVAVANTARTAAEGGGVLILSDLGSAAMNVDTFVELHDYPDDLFHAVHAPLVEGSIAAAVAAQMGHSLHEVARAAEEALLVSCGAEKHCKKNTEDTPGMTSMESSYTSYTPQNGPTSSVSTRVEMGGIEPSASEGGGAEAGGYEPLIPPYDGAETAGFEPGSEGENSASAGAPVAALAESEENPRTTDSRELLSSAPEGRARVRIADPTGLHARPAALLVRALAPYNAQVTVNGADASSVLEVMALGISHGDTVTIDATGPQSREALAVAVELLEGRTSHSGV